jgi:predicted TIM-barrel fold metal-dependent hydrolase
MEGAMIEKHLRRADLVGKTVDIHSHAGIQIRAAAQIDFPYCASVEDLAYRQKANGVDAAVVFPSGPELFFDLPAFIETGRAAPAANPISRAPYERENRLLLTDVYRFCPEHSTRFLPFISVDPGRLVREQIALMLELEAEFPIYGVKIAPVATQTRVTELLGDGEAFFELFAARDWPILFHVAVSQGEEYSQAADTLDVIERHPELRYCLAHCIGFHRGLLERADSLTNVWVDTSALKIQVELAYQNSPLMALPTDRVECNFSNHVEVMRQLVERYRETIIWGTDSPYHSYSTRRLQGEGVYAEFRLKGTYEQEKAALDALTPEQQSQNNANALAFVFGR